MERLLAIWCPELVEEQEDGRRARTFGRVLDTAATFSPAVEVVRPGVCAMRSRGPSRYFGGDERLARRLAAALSDLLASNLPPMAPPQIGVADGLFAALLAARAATGGPVVVDPGGTPAFLALWPVDVLERPELADLLRRLGIRTLGGFAELPVRHVLARLGTDGAACHALSRGVRGELAGIRMPSRTLALAADVPGPPRQPGFWGQAAAAEARAEQAVARAVSLLHPEAVVVGRLQGGRGPAERARLVPWTGRRVSAVGPGAEPWPGRIPAPAPVVVLERPLPAVLVDTASDGVGVSAAGVLSAEPARLSVSGSPWAAVRGWAGPWPADEQWWSGRARRRRARLQLVTEASAAYLLVREHGGWWVEGAYD